MKTKKGVILHGLHPMMQIANAKATLVWWQNGEELVITEAVITRKTGLHPEGKACDYRIWYFVDYDDELDVGKVYEVAAMLQEALGDDYDVIVELDKWHIHCEWDPK